LVFPILKSRELVLGVAGRLRSTDCDRLIVEAAEVVEVAVRREIDGEAHRLDVEVVDADAVDMYRELTSRDFGRRGARALSGSEGNNGGLVGFWLCVVLVVDVVLGFIGVETAATIVITTKIQNSIQIPFFFKTLISV
jgi:hypothetical protein